MSVNATNPSTPPLPTFLLAAVLVVSALVLLMACSTTARNGDESGPPVSVTIQYDPAYLAGADNAAHPAASGGEAPSSSGRIALVGREMVGEGEVFRKEVTVGESSFSVPLAAGHQLDLELAVGARHDARADLGAITVPTQQPVRITIRLDRSGSHLAMTDGNGHAQERNEKAPMQLAPSPSLPSTPPIDERNVVPPAPGPVN